MAIDWNLTSAAVWRPRAGKLRPVRRMDPVRLEDLLGIDAQKAALVANTERFLDGRAANNALLWGSRGTGKSSLVKALLNAYGGSGLRIIEIDKDDLVDLPEIVDDIRELPQRFVIFCDDLSFEEGETGYKHLKSVLEGSIELPPENDRFGLWLSFYPCSLDQYLAIVDSLFPDYQGDREALHLKARQFAQTRASRSGRAARQFALSLG